MFVKRDREPVSMTFEQATSQRQKKRQQTEDNVRKRAWLLSVLGFIPFLILSVLLVFLDNQNPLMATVVDLLKTYAAIILSFLGGVRWGIAVQNSTVESRARDLVLSVVPPLVGWVSLLLSTPFVFALQILVFAAQGAWDSFAGQDKIVELWFAKLRIVLTFGACMALLVAFLGTM